jgi:hypothetical protein
LFIRGERDNPIEIACISAERMKRRAFHAANCLAAAFANRLQTCISSTCAKSQ